MACRRRINGATRSGLRLVMQRLIPKPSLGLFLAARGTFRDNQQFRRVLPRGNTPTQLPAVISEYVMSNCPFRSPPPPTINPRGGAAMPEVVEGGGQKKQSFVASLLAWVIRRHTRARKKDSNESRSTRNTMQMAKLEYLIINQFAANDSPSSSSLRRSTIAVSCAAGARSRSASRTFSRCANSKQRTLAVGLPMDPQG
jgi:hypothetical protein